MARVEVTRNLARHLEVSPQLVEGRTVREVLDAMFDRSPGLRGYIVDDQGGLRKHVVVFVDGEMIRDRHTLSEAVSENTQVVVMQALSGGAR
ncbi:MAG: MoaD/ThiS family protein [Myxococcota bacterium]